jgi:hypothetical protein
MGGLAGGFRRVDERRHQPVQHQAQAQTVNSNGRNSYNRAAGHSYAASEWRLVFGDADTQSIRLTAICFLQSVNPARDGLRGWRNARISFEERISRSSCGACYCRKIITTNATRPRTEIRAAITTASERTLPPDCSPNVRMLCRYSSVARTSENSPILTNVSANSRGPIRRFSLPFVGFSN